MARHGVITETGHKAAAVLHAALSLSVFLSGGEGWSVNSLLFSIGIQWISDVLVSGYRNSIQLHIDIYLFPFGFFSYIGSLRVFSRLPCAIPLFWIIYLVISSEYVNPNLLMSSFPYLFKKKIISEFSKSLSLFLFIN